MSNHKPARVPLPQQIINSAPITDVRQALTPSWRHFDEICTDMGTINSTYENWTERAGIMIALRRLVMEGIAERRRDVENEMTYYRLAEDV